MLSVQFGPLATRVQEALDRHRTLLPPPEEQDEDDQVWRLALHRMDLRQYTAREVSPGKIEGVGIDPAGCERRILFEPATPDPDLQKMINQSAAQRESVNVRLGVQMWGMKIFRGEDGASYDPAQWKERLREARAVSTALPTGEYHELGESGPAFVAAVCVRDHWNELASDEQDWCVELLCDEVERHCNDWDQFARVQRNSMAGDRPAAWVLAGLVVKPLHTIGRERVLRSLVLALTHASDEVRASAAHGAGVHLWGGDRGLAAHRVNLLATEALLVQQAFDVESAWRQEQSLDQVEAEIAAVVRRQFFEPHAIPSDAVQTLDPSTWIGSEAFRGIVSILLDAPEEAVAIEAFSRLARTLVGWWDAHREGQHERPLEIEPVLSDLFERFLIRIPPATARALVQPIQDAANRHPREVSWVLRGLIALEDSQQNTDRFWALWDQFADAIRSARWLASIDDEHPIGGDMISAIFLGTFWKDDTRHWRSLEGYVDRVHKLFEALPASPTVLDDYVRFLYHPGGQSLPRAFIRITRRLEEGRPELLLRSPDTVFMLESLLRRHVYGRPTELKRQTDLRDAVLRLLDMLVEHGSSAAFRMRDDFVTPLVEGSGYSVA